MIRGGIEGDVSPTETNYPDVRVRSECWPGDANGPTVTATTPDFFSLFFDIGSSSSGSSSAGPPASARPAGSYAFWGAGVACSAKSEVKSWNAEGQGSAGSIVSFSIEFDPSFSLSISGSQLSAIYGDDSLTDDQRLKQILLLFADAFRSVNVFLQVFILKAASGADDQLNQAGFGCLYLGFNYGDMIRNLIESIDNGGLAGEADEEAEGGAFFDAVKATAFLAIFDQMYTYPRIAGTGITVDQAVAQTATAATIGGLSLSAAGYSQIGNARVANFTMGGTLSNGVVFNMICYSSTKEFMHLGRSIQPNTLECDLDIDNLAPGVGNANALGVFIVGLGFGVATDVATGTLAFGAGSFSVLNTATCTGSSTCGVLTTNDDACTSVSWLSPDLRAQLELQYSARSVVPICRLYSFDQADATDIFWDPSAEVDQESARATVNSQLSAASSLNASVLTLMLLALVAL